jgi:hypothetical protein
MGMTRGGTNQALIALSLLQMTAKEIDAASEFYAGRP